MTDILLGLILVFVVIGWIEHSVWVSDRVRAWRKLAERVRLARKNRRVRARR